MTWLAIVRIVLWEVSQVLPTVVHGGKIIEICVIYLFSFDSVDSLSNILLKKYYSAEAHT